MNLTRVGWSEGWRPSDDSVNGSPNGLLRMDNLCYDENGIVSLARGYSNVNASPFGYEIHTVYSKRINDTKHRFIGLTDATVRVATGDTFSTILSDASIGKAAFTSGLGFVYIFSGNKNKKYDGTNIYDITPATPSAAPAITEAAKNDFFFATNDYSAFTVPEGTLVANSTYLEFTTVDNKATAQVTYGSPQNSMVLGAGGTGAPWDSFWLVFRASDTQLLTSVRIIANLGSSFDPPTDYYYYQWDNVEGSQYNAGTDSWTVLKCLRQDFQKVSTSDVGDWDAVTGIRIVVESTGEFTSRIGENGILFIGSNENPLNGLYEYIQVDVHNSGSATFRSVASNITPYVNLVNGAAQITPVTPTDPQVNEIWFYRRDVTWLDDVKSIGEPRKLDKWYRVKVLALAEGDNFTDPFVDNVSDEEALLLNFTYPNYPGSVSGYTDDEIIAVTEPFNGRLFMMGRRDIYISYPDDFGLYSNQWTLRLSGDNTEVNLWIKKVSNNQILVGTTLDIYEISGTCEELPEGILDIRITPIGVEYPPIYWSVACDHNIVYYLAADGIRAITGSNSQLISPQLNALFQGSARHGISPIYKEGSILNATTEFSLEISQGKLWFTAKLTDGNKRTFVYDILKQLWFMWDINPNYLYAEEDDTLLGAFTHNVAVMWTGSSPGQNINLLTTFDDNNQPRNRKDVFTLKITADSGNSPINVFLAKDGEGLINLGAYQFNGLEEKLIEIATTVGLGFRYQLQLTGSSLTTFKLYNFTIEYEPRPEQLNYLRLQGNNLGSISRKRFITYAFVIDTLGNSITFTPLIDNVADTPSAAVTPAKTTYIHYFTDETVGTDIGGILSGGTFEFYQLNLEETLSEKLPPPTKYLLIPANDYGNPNRKRHSSYKFQINTRGNQVRFTPRIDGVSYTALDFSTSEKRTVEYYFPSDTIGIDIGGTLESLDDTPFEFYGVIVPQELELFPPKLEYFRIPENNYGIPAKKRIRTMPMEINTNGNNVTFTPIVDGVAQATSVFNTTHRQTVLHYFTDDQFGIDYSGQLEGSEWFEFYGLAKPVDVEILPVGKKYDQVGPLDLDRMGKLMGFRVKLYTTGSEIPFNIFMNDVSMWTGTITTIPNKLHIYEVMRIPKTVYGTSLRIEFGPTTDVFHRYWAKARLNLSGLNTDNTELPFP